MHVKRGYLLLPILFLLSACGKNNSTPNPNPPVTTTFSFASLSVNGNFNGFTYYGVPNNTRVKFGFSESLDRQSISNAVSFRGKSGSVVNFTYTFENNDSVLVIQPA